ncbi:MAG TPA: hypothetical protein VKB38_10710 [Terracidiphilus sp.]|nr:hypothetical protein [Terracidiphilus sp.]
MNLHSRCSSPMISTLLLAVLLGACGCSSSSSRQPQVGPIGFTNAMGASQPTVTALTAGQGTYLEVTIADDTALLGANWSVTCESALPPGTPLPPGQTQDTSCGTYAPQHTISGPVPSYATSATGYVTFYTAPAAPPKGGTVTLYATSTADPSQNSTVTLTINP